MTQAEEVHKKACEVEERAREAFWEKNKRIQELHLLALEAEAKAYNEKLAKAYEPLKRAKAKAYNAFLKVEDEKHADRTNTEK